MKRNRIRKSTSANYHNRSRKKKKGQNNILWSMLIVGVLSSFALFIYISASQKSINVDKITMCPLDKSLINAHTIIFLDVTDKLPTRYSKILLSKVTYIEKHMKKYDKFTILVLSEEEDNYIHEKFSMCSPGRGKEIDPLVGSPKLVEQKWKEIFHNPLKRLIATLEKIPEAKRTPLFDGIDQVMDRLDFDDTVQSRKLLFISDMMHSTKDFSNYKHRANKYLLESDFIKNFDFDFTGIDVEILLIKREKLKKHQTKVFKNFWIDFFELNGVNNLKIH